MEGVFSFNFSSSFSHPLMPFSFFFPYLILERHFGSLFWAPFSAGLGFRLALGNWKGSLCDAGLCLVQEESLGQVSETINAAFELLIFFMVDMKNLHRLSIMAALVLLGFQLCETSAEAGPCNRRCGSRTVNYPFGFSGSCPYLLDHKCSPNGTVYLRGFQVIHISNSSIKISIVKSNSSGCYQNGSLIPQLFGSSFGLSGRNVLLYKNCSENLYNCLNVTGINNTNLAGDDKRRRRCRSNDLTETGCLWNDGVGRWLSWTYLQTLRCKYMISSFVVESFGANVLNLEVDALELAWWIDGGCSADSCAENAICSAFPNPQNKTVHSCYCKEGFVGDGFREGAGCRKSGHKSKTGVVISCTVAGCIVIILTILLCLVCRKKTRRESKSRTEVSHESLGIPVYSYEIIEKATKSFSDTEKLGSGAYGTVYAGKLSVCNGSRISVAVKKMRHRDDRGIDQVLNEIRVLSSVSHPNLVKLLGCCLDSKDPILLYEFMPKGTLAEHLQRERGEVLPWPIRLRIAAETANALAYLHFTVNPPIYHRDIKSTNILLDYDFHSKVADFGLSRLAHTDISHVSTAPQGTPGYVDPQYHENFLLSDKSDVYSFGVVLAEILTGLKVVDFSRKETEVNLASLTLKKIGEGRLDEIIDPFLAIGGDANVRVGVQRVGELAFRCLAFDRNARPNMAEVCLELDSLVHNFFSPQCLESQVFISSYT